MGHARGLLRATDSVLKHTTTADEPLPLPYLINDNWRVDVASWQLFVDTGTCDLPMWHFFAQLVHRLQPTDCVLYSPYVLQTQTPAADSTKVLSLPRKTALEPKYRMYPYLTKSQHWVVFVADRAASVLHIFAQKRTASDSYDWTTKRLCAVLSLSDTCRPPLNASQGEGAKHSSEKENWS